MTLKSNLSLRNAIQESKVTIPIEKKVTPAANGADERRTAFLSKGRETAASPEPSNVSHTPFSAKFLALNLFEGASKIQRPTIVTRIPKIPPIVGLSPKIKNP